MADKKIVSISGGEIQANKPNKYIITWVDDSFSTEIEADFLDPSISGLAIFANNGVNGVSEIKYIINMDSIKCIEVN